MPEVAEVGEPRRPVAPHVEHHARWKPSDRVTSGPTTIHRCSTAASSARPGRDEQRRTPGGAEGPGDQLREDAAEGQRADHDAHRQPPPVDEPAHHELHPDRVDQRQRGSRHEPERDRRHDPVDDRRRGERRQRRDGRAERHQPRRVDPVGEVRGRGRQRPDDEAELDADRQQRLADATHLPLRAQRGRRGRRGEPRRHRHHLDGGDQRQLAYGGPAVRLGHRRGGSHASTVGQASGRQRGPSRRSITTCSGVSSSSVVTPSSRIVRSTCPRRISMIRSTPSRPPAIRP